jgi:hypothetical protein
VHGGPARRSGDALAPLVAALRTTELASASTSAVGTTSWPAALPGSESCDSIGFAEGGGARGGVKNSRE